MKKNLLLALCIGALFSTSNAADKPLMSVLIGAARYRAFVTKEVADHVLVLRHGAWHNRSTKCDARFVALPKCIKESASDEPFYLLASQRIPGVPMGSIFKRDGETLTLIDHCETFVRRGTMHFTKKDTGESDLFVGDISFNKEGHVAKMVTAAAIYIRGESGGYYRYPRSEKAAATGG